MATLQEREFVKAQKAASGMMSKELAERAGVSESTLYVFLRGDNVRQSSVDKIMAVFQDAPQVEPIKQHRCTAFRCAVGRYGRLCCNYCTEKCGKSCENSHEKCGLFEVIER